jgi:signal transduction histidine kinase
VKLRRLQSELAIRNKLLESTNAELDTTLRELRDAGAQLVQAERLAAVGELAAGMAHEINNPLNFALNAMKALGNCVEDVRTVAAKVAALSEQDPGALRESLRELEALRRKLSFDENVETLSELEEIVTEGLVRTTRLVGDLRDFAAPGSRSAGQIDVARGLCSTFKLVRHVFVKAGIEIQEEIAPHLPLLEGDARSLNQVFLNLLKNAAEAMEGRKGRVEVRARTEKNAIIVEIEDDGPGIAPELRDRLFEPFFTTKPAGKGTGLGLSISRRIVTDLNGSIELGPAPDGGTCARVTLPVPGGAKEPESAVQP